MAEEDQDKFSVVLYRGLETFQVTVMGFNNSVQHVQSNLDNLLRDYADLEYEFEPANKYAPLFHTHYIRANYTHLWATNYTCQIQYIPAKIILGNVWQLENAGMYFTGSKPCFQTSQALRYHPKRRSIAIPEGQNSPHHSRHVTTPK